MTTSFIAEDLWSTLTRAAKAAKLPSFVAVAYFGSKAAELLPLRNGSRLVVDASDRTVAAGQTCPAELLKLVKRGVRVYNVPNLHAKVFVLGDAAFIGSANVSQNSATQLMEAALRTTEASAVRAARRFVQGLCYHEFESEKLKALAKLYHPPKIPGGRKGKKAADRLFAEPTLPRLMLAQLEREKWTEREQELHDKYEPKAKQRRKRPETDELDSFVWTGRRPCQRGDVVIQVTDEGRGKVLVSPPGNVLLVETDRKTRPHSSVVFAECPKRRRRKQRVLAKQLGRGALNRLKANGEVKDAKFVRALLNAWTP